MRKTGKIPILASLVVIAAFAGAAGNGWSHAYSPRATAQNLEQVSGRILSVRQVSQPGRAWTGTHLTLQSATGTLNVALGPSDYVEAQGVSLKPGDQVSVTGLRASGDATMIAYSVQRGGELLRLRTETGAPLWAGGRRS